MNACMNVIGQQPGWANSETSARNQTLAQCSQCRAYANSAVEAVKQGRSVCNSANLSGSRWTDNVDKHMNACMNVIRQQPGWANSETSARNQTLAQCTQCRAYANSAVEAVKQARSVCNPATLSGSRWTDNLGQHMNACMNILAQQPGWAKAETDARTKFIEDCQGKNTTIAVDTGGASFDVRVTGFQPNVPVIIVLSGAAAQTERIATVNGQRIITDGTGSVQVRLERTIVCKTAGPVTFTAEDADGARRTVRGAVANCTS
jgi:hypothetical protein